MKFAFAVAALAGAVVADMSDHWAVIMAGSNTYSNYRHQADSHHAVKIMLENGIPRDQIIHLAYDDVANHWRNPYPGQLFNHPDPTGPGVNVYDSSEIDYRGDDVTAANFYKVLLGDTSANGPVLGSDSNSRVFVYFTDHGAPGLIATPSGPYIYADDLNETLLQAKANGMFKEMVFYLEACESGSMFPNITADDSIYAMTASNAELSSWAAYCGSDANIDGVSIGSCLGDLFSVNWMEDTEANNVQSETLTTQYNTVLTETSASPVQKFGDFSFMSEPIGDFEGIYEGSATERILHKLSAPHKQQQHHRLRAHKSELVDSREVDIHYHTQRVMSEGSPESYAELQAEIEHRQFVDELFNSEHFEITRNAPATPENYDCLKMMVQGAEDMCGKFTAYSLKYVRKLSNVCDTKTPEEIADIYVKIGNYCGAF